MTFQIALDYPHDKNFQKNLPNSIAVVSQQIQDVDRALASLKIDPELKTELAPVLLTTGTDLSAMKDDPRKAKESIEHYNSSNRAVIINVRYKIEEKLKNLPALDHGPTPAKLESNEKK